MSSEINIQGSININKGFLSLVRTANYEADMTGTHCSLVAQSIGTTAEPLDIDADVATAGAFWFRNLDDTNFVTVGTWDAVHSTYTPLIKLFPGEVASGRLATTTVYAVADTASVVLEHCVLEA